MECRMCKLNRSTVVVTKWFRMAWKCNQSIALCVSIVVVVAAVDFGTCELCTCLPFQLTATPFVHLPPPPDTTADQRDNDTWPEWVMQWYRWHCLFVVSKSSWELKWITERVTNLIARENCHIYGAKGNELLWYWNGICEWEELLWNMNKEVTLNFIELSFKFWWHLMFIYSLVINQSNRIVYGAYYKFFRQPY